MDSEDQDILAKISQLAGQINKHKNNQTQDRHTKFHAEARTSNHPIYPHTNTAWRPSRGGHSGRGFRSGRPPPVHRNRTLVLNGNSAITATPESMDIDTEDAKISAKPTNTGPSWVMKKDRHLQLINTTIFEKESQNRAKAMEETRKQKVTERNTREKTKFNRHLQRIAGSASQYRPPGAPVNYEINVQGIQFGVTRNGSKLVKSPGEHSLMPSTCKHEMLFATGPGLPRTGDLNAAKATPKTALIGGVKFHRSKNGNMYRSGIIKAHRTAAIKKINEPCKMFTTTGSCTKGPKCRYIHDPSKVAACKEFLLKGSCPSGDSCDLSHQLTPERTPFCLHFAKGNCSNAICRYTHVRVSPNALVCRAFGIYGYCEKGAACEEHHVHECPDFSNTGTCTTKGCKLPHKYKASIMRTHTNRGEASPENDSSDLSSDEEDEEIDSDDVDSDDLDEEFFGDEDGKPDVEAMQQNFVQLS